ncbi:MAG TPA: hypothetical protein VHL05_14990 [Terriglobales bacterium]|jgi:hypothetical protein|nr:hypothetical protein [Terriglobales bacterium]
METDYAKALLKLKQSDEWIDLICPLPGGGYNKYAEYLRNRIITAFDAGWNARAALSEGAKDG